MKGEAKLYVIPGSHACRTGMLLSLALLMYRVDLEPRISARPAGALVDRLLPEPVTSG